MPSKTPLNAQEQAIEEIAELTCVKEALFALVFRKLFFDGYVNCQNAIATIKKEDLQIKLKAGKSGFSNWLEGRNAKTLPELSANFQKLPAELRNKNLLSNTEMQSVIYSIAQARGGMDIAELLYLFLQSQYGKTRYSVWKTFLKADDVEIMEIASLDSFIGALSKLPNDTNLVFRGHSNINYQIVPSLFREPRFYRNENMLFQELVIRCPDNFANCRTHLDFLVEMQHYGLPTRLLDFTFNPLVALFFACDQPAFAGEVIVYSLSNREVHYEKSDAVAISSCLASLTYGEQKKLLAALTDDKGDSRAVTSFTEKVLADFPTLSREVTYADVFQPVFVKPVRRNLRVTHQQGAFLIWGLGSGFYVDHVEEPYQGDIEKFRYSANNKKQIYYIPANKKDSVHKMLNLIGINHAYIYPEIDDVAKYLKDEIQ